MSNWYKGADRQLLILLMLGAAGCDSNQSSLTSPLVSGVAAASNPNNVLSAVVSVTVANAGKVRVSYQSETGPLKSTPEVAVSAPGTLRLPVFELRPDTNYFIWVTAIGIDGKSVDSPPVSLMTGSLPDPFPAFLVERPGNPQPGYTMVSFTGMPIGDQNTAVIVDQDGRIVWYQQFSDGFVADWQQQPDGTYTAAVSSADQSAAEYRQFDRLGNQLRTWSEGGDLETDNHELRLLSNGDALFFGVNHRTMDLQGVGGQEDAAVFGNVLLRMSSTNQVLFQWDAFEHLPAIDDLDPLIDPTGAVVDWTHANALDVAADGNYLVSFRNLSQVVKIDAHSGAVLWKLGGWEGDFTFVDDPLDGFSLQHAIRELPNGNLLLFDNGNGHDPPQSRAVEYQLDVAAKLARMVWQYNANPPLYGFFAGFTQRLGNGNTLISYGALPQVLEVNPTGDIQWNLRAVGSGFIYRSFRIPSLY